MHRRVIAGVTDPLGTPRQRSTTKSAPLEAFSRTEKLIAFCRILLALATLVIVVVDPKQPSFAPDVGLAVLWAYLAYSLVLFVLVRGEHVRQEDRKSVV